MIFGVNADANNHLFFEFQANDTLRIASNTAASTVIQLITTQFFRDPSQWYNIVFVFDLLNSTQADRVRLFVNGVRVTAFSTNTLPANITTITTVNASGIQHYIGRYAASSTFYFGGYIADVNLVDGLALTPSSFTATDANTGQLVPAQYTGAFGINGFYLPLSSAALAVDLGQNPKTTNQDYPYWKNNTLLVDTTNTNGQQNNSFSDSSQFGIGITRNGNTTQGTVSPFYLGSGTEQANGYYSGVFDGNGDFINFTQRTIAGSFTCECWFWRGANVTQYHVLFGGPTTATPSTNTQLTVTNTGAVTMVIGGAGAISVAGTAVAQFQWNHIAYVRSGTSCAVFVNGQRVGTGTSSASLTVDRIGTIGGVTAGSYEARGFISNARITDSAVYNPALTSITVPTAPLTAIDPTQLLTCQSSVFSDNSLNNSVITPNGNARPVQDNPFGMTAWSGYFDGTGDYLTAPNSNASYAFAADFTVQCWINPQTVTYTIAAYWTPGAATSCSWVLSTNASFLVFSYGIGGTNASFTATTGAIPLNSWTHVAVSRSGSTLRLFVNGQVVLSTTLSGALNNVPSNPLNIARLQDGTGSFNGYLSNLQIVNGTALYTANFTPPTAPLTAVTNTRLLTCQSSTFIDNSTNAFPITVFGNSSTLTLINPFNSSVNYTTPPPNGYGLYFNGVNENTYVSVPISITFGLTSNHVIEFDYFCDDLADHSSTSSTASQQLFTFGSFTTYLNVGIDVNGQIAGNYRADTINNVFSSANGVIGAQQWYRIRWQKIGTAMSLFVNNVQVTSTVTITAGALTFTSVALGRFFYNAGSLFNGWALGKMANLTITQNGVTLLDTFRSPYLRDFSSNNYTITLNGVCSTVPLSPTMPTSAYDAVSMGGSAYFDGTGDYLTLANSGALQLGSNSFTVEGWFYFSTFVAVDPLYVLNSAASYAALRLQRDTASTISVYISNNGSSWANQITNIGSFAPSTWNHIAVTREGTTGLIRVYQNGTLIGSGTNASALHAGTVNYINAIQSGGSPGIGYSKYISGFRVLIGRNLYPSSFTPPVAPPTNILLTNFLANFTAAGIYDATGQNVLETVGNVQVSTAVKKFGETSMFFDGSGDYLVIPTTNAPCQFSTFDFTIEAWIYSTSIANQQMILSNRIAATGSANFDWQIVSSRLLFGTTSTNLLTGTITLSSNTWYHVAVSRVSGTARMFVNGVLDVSTTTSFNLSNNSITHIGTNATYAPTQYPFIGYIQDLRISKVGRYSGAFTPPAAAFAYNQYDIGNQQWTPTNISVTAGVGQDNLVDSPSDYGTDTGLGGQVRGNYATLSPLSGDTNAVLSNGNLTVTGGTASGNSRYGTFGVSSGKWYWDYTMTIIGVNGQMAGVTTDITQTTGLTGVKGYYFNGNKYDGATPSAYGATFTTNDVIGVALDMDAGTITFYKNGVSQGVAFSGLTGTYFPLARISAGIQGDFNFGQRAFQSWNGSAYVANTAPAGFKCLVSTNLPTVNGIGATSSTQASDYFNPILYTGTGASLGVTGVGFQPDLVWVKGRSGATDHGWYDAVRGVQKQLESNTTDAETTQTTGLTAFGSDGFTVGSLAQLNTSAATYVAWNWKANGAGVANTDGTTPSTVSANTTNGCSIVTYTGTGANATVGHGLGVAPSFITVKQRNGTWSWMTYHVSLPTNAYVLLNDTAAQATSRPDVYNGAPSSTVINIGNNATINGSGSTYVAYCFAPVSGFSAMGSYTGNGSADGPMIYTNFRPAYVLVKCSTTARNWEHFDSARDTYNVVDLRLQPNLANAEASGTTAALLFADFLSNGFKIRGTEVDWNQSGSTYVYIAFAAFPFKYSRAF
jgi:hypothetical protein